MQPWETLTPRERDMLVAERVLGWVRKAISPPMQTFMVAPAGYHVVQPSRIVGPGVSAWGIDFGGPDYLETPDGQARYVRGAWPYGPESEIPHFTTDLVAAWQLVEHVTQPHADKRNVRFSSLWRAVDLWTRPASEAAELLCMMALAAVEMRPIAIADEETVS